MPKVMLMHPSRFDPSELEPDQRKAFLSKDDEVNARMKQFGAAGLRLGKALTEMQEILGPERRFVRWLKSKMPAKTGYRLIGAWQRVKEFSPSVAERAVAADIPMFGVTDRAPFGKYTQAIKLLPPPPKDDDPQKADAWLLQLRNTLLDNPELRRHKLSKLDSIAEFLANRFLRDKKAKDFEEWLEKVSERTQAIIDKRKDRQ